MASTGIIQRRQSKAYFEIPENRPIVGEIVYAIDTDEYGSLNKDGVTIDWVPHRGFVTSVAGKRQDVILDKSDVGLDQVDNTSDLDKPISNAVKQWQDDHLAAVNPHNITKAHVGLGDVDNTSDLNKPVSTAVQEKLTELDNKKVDNSRVLTDVPANAKFTDTTYEVKDGELSEINFTEARRLKLDNLESSNLVLATPGLTIKGRKITLTRGDGSFETIETQDSTYNDSFLVQEIDKLKKSKVDNSRVLTDVPANAKFTDTLYDDAPLKEEMKVKHKEINDSIVSKENDLKQSINDLKEDTKNKYLLKTEKAADSKLLNGKAVTSDYTIEDETIPASIAAVKRVNDSINARIPKTDILNDFTGGTDKVLSAEKGKDLKIEVDRIKDILKSNDTDLDTIQEIVDFVKRNKDKIGQAVGIESIVGLPEALAKKLNTEVFTAEKILELLKTVDTDYSGLNADTLDGLQADQFNQVIGIDLINNVATDGLQVIGNLHLDKGVVKQLDLVDLDKRAVRLGNVNNTSDADKPVSTAQQAALDLKVTAVTGTTDTAPKAKESNNTTLFNNEPESNFARAKTITNINQADKPGIYKIDASNYSIIGKSFTIDNVIWFSAGLKLHMLEPNAETLIENNGVFSELKGSGGSGSAETPQTILAKLLTVDGRGSNLDADLLGGVNYAQYALKSDYLDKTTVDNKFSDVNNKLNGVAKVIYSQTEPTDKNAIWVRETNNFNDNLFVETVPVGSYVSYSSLNTVPDGFMVCDGRSLTKTDYPELFAVIGYTYGGSGENFNIPVFNDGRFMRSTGGNASGLGVLQNATRIPNLGIYKGNGTASLTSPRTSAYENNTQLSIVDSDDPVTGAPAAYYSTTLSLASSTSASTHSTVRPKNSSVVVLIKVKNNIKFLNSSKVKVSDNLDDLTAVPTVKAVKEHIDYINPNLIMNGNFCSFERSNKEIFNISDKNNADYLTDRWQVFSNVSDLKWQGGITSGTRKFLSIEKTGGTGNCALCQFIEKGSLFPGTEQVTVSFVAVATKNKEIKVELQAVKDRFVESSEVVSKTVNITNRSAVYSVTLNTPSFFNLIPSDNEFDTSRLALVLKINIGDIRGDKVMFADIKLEKGTKATKFVNYGGGEEADRQACLRYFERISGELVLNDTHYTTSPKKLNIIYKAKKRATPHINIGKSTPAGTTVKGTPGLYNCILIAVSSGSESLVEDITIDADF